MKTVGGRQWQSAVIHAPAHFSLLSFSLFRLRKPNFQIFKLANFQILPMHQNFILTINKISD